MLSAFQSYVTHSLGLGSQENILLAVSGGIDSVVMADLFIRSGFHCAFAHCNFGLRGEESEGDEYFVRNLASVKGIPCFTRRFNTEEYAAAHKISIQMAARELRYAWFEQLRKEKTFRRVAVAHTRSDQIETFLINLSRGTGIRGLTGMQAVAGNLIRPVLFAGRTDIQAYARSQQLPYREDASNQEVYYTRNRIRHLIIPGFQELNPRFEQTLEDNIRKLKEVEEVFLDAVEQAKELLVNRAGDHVWIDLNGLNNRAAPATLLFEILKDYHFSSPQAQDIFASLTGSPGKQFFSPTNRLIRDRDRLIITPCEEECERIYYIEEEIGMINEPLRLAFRIVENSPGNEFPRNRDIACLDYGLVSFPLIIRKWRKGDYFHPLGMEGMKKLSDFFIDRKYSLLEKEKAWLLAMGDRILWIIGERIDHQFRVTEDTSRILQIGYHREPST